MALAKNDNPNSDKPATASTRKADEGADAATEEALDAGAGVPNSMKQAAERLPTKDKVQQAYKDQMLADDTEAEVSAKATIINESPDADQTPSGAALLAVQGESDPIKQGEKYSRVKSAVRNGTVESAENVK